MSERMHRIVDVAVGPKDGAGVFFTTQTESVNLLKASNLHISFNIKKSTSKEANDGTVAITNMMQSTFDKINSCSNPVLILKAGHLYTVNQIIYGNVLSINRQKSAGNNVTTFRIAEGVREDRLGVLQKSYAPGTKISTIVNDCKQVLGGLGIKVHNPWKVLGQKEEGEFEILENTVRHGVTAHECALSILTKILKKFNYNVYISNNALIIAPYKGAIDDQGLVFNSKSGLIESPFITKEGVVKFKALIDSRLSVGSRFKLESMNINNYFTVKDIVFTGDNFDGAFEMQVEAV